MPDLLSNTAEGATLSEESRKLVDALRFEAIFAYGNPVAQAKTDVAQHALEARLLTLESENARLENVVSQLRTQAAVDAVEVRQEWERLSSRVEELEAENHQVHRELSAFMDRM